MGRIVHRRIVKIKRVKNRGELITESDWILPSGKKILTETTRYIFQAKGGARWIDRETTLTANDDNVTFGDSKEGLFALHLSSELQQPSSKPEKITDENGNISLPKTNDKFTGEYQNSEGSSGDKIWGTPGKWASVSGRIGNEEVTAAVFDSPQNYNFPSYMMVRGYGLLALNPFGRKSFEPAKEARRFVLEPNKSIAFRHRLLILAEKAAPDKIELDATSKEIGNNQMFIILDLNGGTLSNGDSVKLIFGQSQMREDKDAAKIHRVPIRGAKDEECIFKILVTGKNILLQTPSGRFVAASADGKSIITTDKKDETSLLTAVPNPAPKLK